jgi:hypothetical protein
VIFPLQKRLRNAALFNNRLGGGWVAGSIRTMWGGAWLRIARDCIGITELGRHIKCVVPKIHGGISNAVGVDSDSTFAFDWKQSRAIRSRLWGS